MKTLTGAGIALDSCCWWFAGVSTWHDCFFLCEIVLYNCVQSHKPCSISQSYPGHRIIWYNLVVFLHYEHSTLTLKRQNVFTFFNPVIKLVKAEDSGFRIDFYVQYSCPSMTSIYSSHERTQSLWAVQFHSVYLILMAVKENETLPHCYPKYTGKKRFIYCCKQFI